MNLAGTYLTRLPADLEKMVVEQFKPQVTFSKRDIDEDVRDFYPGITISSGGLLYELVTRIPYRWIRTSPYKYEIDPNFISATEGFLQKIKDDREGYLPIGDTRANFSSGKYSLRSGTCLYMSKRVMIEFILELLRYSISIAKIPNTTSHPRPDSTSSLST